MAWIKTQRHGYVNTDFLYRIAVELTTGTDWVIEGRWSYEDHPSIVIDGPFTSQEDAEGHLESLLGDIQGEIE